ncbi:MAG: cation:proton antiporter subunit C [Thermoanaerobaculia bacterium]
MSLLPYLVTLWLLMAGLYGVIRSRNLVQMTICLWVLQASTYVLLLSIGYVAGAGPPIFDPRHIALPSVDPVVQAMTLTDIVIGATLTALLLAMAVELEIQAGKTSSENSRPLRR